MAVDLPGGQTLFALLNWDSYRTLQMGFGGDSEAILDAAKANGRVGLVRLPITAASRADPINCYQGYPQFVRFKNDANPMSVEEVSPADLAKSFGPRVTLNRITVQMTDEPVTREIEKRLPWLKDYASRRARLNGNTSSVVATNNLSDNLDTGSFSIE